MGEQNKSGAGERKERDAFIYSNIVPKCPHFLSLSAPFRSARWGRGTAGMRRDKAVGLG